LSALFADESAVITLGRANTTCTDQSIDDTCKSSFRIALVDLSIAVIILCITAFFGRLNIPVAKQLTTTAPENTW
tara:strand:- start:884 stop:1108 length:225 start_codon:yes stop_codon:yes gene_type:complete